MMRLVFCLAMWLGAIVRMVKKFRYNIRKNWNDGFSMYGAPKGMSRDAVLSIRDGDQKRYTEVQNERAVKQWRTTHPPKPIIVVAPSSDVGGIRGQDTEEYLTA